MSMKVLGVISARAGSKSVPRKNLRALGDRPLLAYMIASARQARLIDRLILTTEDDEIASVGRAYGIEVPFKRPPELASDQATGIEVAKHSLEAMDALGWRADVHVHLFPTCPFLPPAKIDEAIKLVLEGCDSAIGVQDTGHFHPFRAVTFDAARHLQPFGDNPNAGKPVNRQDLPAVYSRCGAVYARRRRLLDQWQGKDFALGDIKGGVVLSDIEAVNIDRPIDFGFAEFLVATRRAEVVGNLFEGLEQAPPPTR